MVVRKYEIIFECARYISYLQATNNKVFDDFPYISDCFLKTSEDCRRLPRKIRRCFNLISITLGLFSIVRRFTSEDMLFSCARFPSISFHKLIIIIIY